ncbi:MAG: fructose-bisphosphate aldolase [Acidobacteria bacterium]|nr:fructose-bisphosphate aldolase [Acidobacteriota bacterium]
MTQLDEMGLGAGKKARLHRILYGSGPGNGKGIFLPVDQGLEHGPRDFVPNWDAADSRWLFRLAKEGRFSAIVLQVGQAQKYFWEFAGEVPLVLKLNGKTEIPPDDEAFSPVLATVEQAVRLGADAVGYTMYVGSPVQDRDFIQFREVREEADRYGMPLIVWAYPRGSAIKNKGGRDSLYAVAYAARVAAETGADMVKINFPKPSLVEGAPKPYSEWGAMEPLEAARHAIDSAQRTPVLISGGEKESDDAIVEKARLSFEAGATGLIFGRNMFQRKLDGALRLCERLHELCQKFGS